MEYKDYYYFLKRNEFDCLRDTYIRNGTVSWATFSADQECHQKKVVELAQSDFDEGTLRIRYPCMLKLTESVQFNPNRPTTWLDNTDSVTSDFSEAVKLDPDRTLDWLPDMSVTSNAQYFEPEVAFSYGLGFFAAIAIESHDTILNLNGFTLAQHPEHALQQRFFALVELADQPFIPFQGPSNFGAVLRVARNVLIHNGTLGLASHHGIHGNNCDNVMIEDVMFKDFEVAAQALNGSKNLWMKNVVVAGNRQNIPVLGTYSVGRFLKLFVERLQNSSPACSSAMLDYAYENLITELENGFNAIIFSNGTVPALFENTTGLIDGTCYGLVFNPKGVAVNGFMADRTTYRANETTGVCMIKCSVDNIRGNIQEIVGLGNPDGGMQVDTAGALLQFFNGVSVLNESTEYHYQGTVLSEVQIELARLKMDLESTTTLSPGKFGTLKIHEGIIEWRDDDTTYFEFVNGQLQLFNSNGTPFLLGSPGQPVIYDVFCNGDTMFHVNKGVIGMRIDGVNNLKMDNCSVTRIANEGDLGSDLCGAYTTSHPAATGTGYGGARTFGVVMNAVNDVTVSNLQLCDIESVNSSAYGLAVQNGSINSTFENVNVKDVKSNADGTFDPTAAVLPNVPEYGRGLFFGPDCFNLSLSNGDVKDVTNSSGNPFSGDIDIKCSINLS